jgi:hypothetical protein
MGRITATALLRFLAWAPPAELILGVDAFDIPLHGIHSYAQFHADYDHYGDLPLLAIKPGPGGREIFGLDHLPGRVPAGPRPLEVVAAQVAGHVHHFANKIKPRHLAGFHGF